MTPHRLVVTLLLGAALGACDGSPPAPAVDTTPPPAVDTSPPPPPAPPPKPAPKVWDMDLNNSARVLAGLDVPADAKLYAITQSPDYAKFKKQTDAAWTPFEAKDLTKIRDWSTTNLASLPGKTVFYPFSGPDMLNALAMLPQGDTYILMGLEKVGSIPRLDDVPAAQILKSGQDVRGTLTTLLGANFFKTKDMRLEIGQDPYNGIAAIMMWFMVRSGYDVLDARMVQIGPDGSVGDVPHDIRPTAKVVAPQGVEITFRKTGETTDEAVKKAYYFSGDISDSAWSTALPGLPQFVEAQPSVVTFLKAASYLMFQKDFDDIRSEILSRSVAVVEDDAGVPYHFFANDGWDLTFFGAYTPPIPLFYSFCQQDLDDAMAGHSAGDIPFDFGYTHKTPHMVVAKRTAKNPVAMPTYDGSGAKGTSSPGKCKKPATPTQ